MTDCTDEMRHMVPLNTAVNAAMIDAYEDVGRSKQLFSHWAARGLKMLYGQNIPKKVRRTIIVINPKTYTAALPIDFDVELFVGVIDELGHKVPILLNTDIAIDKAHLSFIERQGSSCPRCGSDKDICEDLQSEETSETVVFDGTPYELTTVKRLYPNGDYYLERKVPYWDTEESTVEYRTERELIQHFDRSECGCLETSDENLWKLQTCASEVYNCYYAGCDYGARSTAGYKVFTDQNIIQFDRAYKYDRAYMEYNAFLQKHEGKYWIPEVAFETIVEWTKFKSVDGKRNVSPSEKQWRWSQYLIAKGNMVKSLGKFSLSQLIAMIDGDPKFD